MPQYFALLRFCGKVIFCRIKLLFLLPFEKESVTRGSKFLFCRWNHKLFMSGFDPMKLRLHVNQRANIPLQKMYCTYLHVVILYFSLLGWYHQYQHFRDTAHLSSCACAVRGETFQRGGTARAQGPEGGHAGTLRQRRGVLHQAGATLTARISHGHLNYSIVPDLDPSRSGFDPSRSGSALDPSRSGSSLDPSISGSCLNCGGAVTGITGYSGTYCSFLNNFLMLFLFLL